MPVRRRRQRAPHRPARGDRPHPPRLPARRRSGAALRLPGARAVEAGRWPAVQPAQAADRPLRQGGGGTGPLAPFGLRLRPRGRAGRHEQARQCRPHPAVGGHLALLRVGRRPAAPDPVARDGDLRAPREGLHRAEPDRPRAPARHLRRPDPARGPRVPPGSRGHRSGAVAGPPVRPRPLPARARPAQLLGLQLHRLPGAAERVLQPGRAVAAGAGVQADGQDAAPGRHRGDPRRRLQPHRRGEPPGSPPVTSWHRQRRLLPLVAGRPALLRRLHRHRQLAEHAPPPRAAADHGQPSVLGAGDARGRLPLRPGGHAGARAPRRRPAVGVLRPDPAGPRHQPDQAHRRTVGRGRGRLPGGELPPAVVGVERQVPRHRARLLAGIAGDPGRAGIAVHRQL